MERSPFTVSSVWNRQAQGPFMKGNDQRFIPLVDLTHGILYPPGKSISAVNYIVKNQKSRAAVSLETAARLFPYFVFSERSIYFCGIL